MKVAQTSGTERGFHCHSPSHVCLKTAHSGKSNGTVVP